MAGEEARRAGESSISLRMIRPVDFEQVVIPIKTTKEADWIQQLTCHIVEMGEDPNDYRAEIAQFNRMRQDARHAPISPAGVDILISYYRQLDSLSKRLPIVEVPLTILFVWYDSFDPNYSVKQTSIAFEKANVLYNIGALLSQLARGGKDKAKNYQCAATTFTFIGENFLHPPLVDIMKPSLQFITALMLAQAQEEVVEKAVKDEKSFSILSKLAAAATGLFGQAMAKLSSTEMADVCNYLLSGAIHGYDRDPYTLLQIKVGLWAATREYFAGEAAYKEERVGEAIVRLCRAGEISKETLDSCPFAGSAKVIIYLRGLTTYAAQRSAALSKENGLIYTQSIPEGHTLEPIEGALLVKAGGTLGESWRWVPERRDLFQKLIPLRMHEEISKYSEEKSKLLRYESLKVSTASSDFHSTLTALGFPGAFDVVLEGSGGDDLPKEFQKLATAARLVANAREIVDSLEPRVEAIRGVIGEISGLLDEEIAVYQKSKLEHGSELWSQEPSHVGNSEIFRMLSTLEQRIYQAYEQKLSKSSGAIYAITPQMKQDMAILTGPADALLRLVRTGSTRSNSGIEDEQSASDRGGDVERVRCILEELEGLSTGRTGMLSKLKEQILADDISDSLALAKGQDISALFHEELGKFDKTCSLIEENISRNTNLLSEFKQLWAAVSGKFKKESAMRESVQNELIARFSCAIEAYRKAHEGARYEVSIHLCSIRLFTA